ncbi:MAG TPA: gliding motility-associated protein GldE, partial [Bacteroidales bacterium]|nr:gliding motility-associated protein GldE [Bacteroidales bacterium]
NPERLDLNVSITTVFVIVISFLLLFPVFQSLLSFNWLAVFLLTIAFGMLLLVFTELLPRLFSKAAESYSLAMAYPLSLIDVLFRPFSYMIENITGNQGRRVQSNKHHISIEDISSALELTTDSLNDEEVILQGLVNFGNIDVQKILKPRIDVIAVDKEIDGEELYQIIIDSEYSRIPVFSESFDNIIGILYVKDLLPHLRDLNNFDWSSLIRPPYFVPETKKVKELLKELQTQKIQMAVVVDEYGGTTGIVTLEDILEEIVGEIADESDEDEETFKQIDDNTFVFDGITLLEDLYRITQCDETVFDAVRGEADTLAGIILELKGEIPENGDEFEFAPFKFIVEQVDNRRIKQVKVIINKEEEPEEEKS